MWCVLRGLRIGVALNHEDGSYSVRVNGYVLKLTTAWTGAEKVTAFSVDGERYYAQVERTDISYSVVHAGFLVSALILESHTSELYDFMPLRNPKRPESPAAVTDARITDFD